MRKPLALSVATNANSASCDRRSSRSPRRRRGGGRSAPRSGPAACRASCVGDARSMKTEGSKLMKIEASSGRQRGGVQKMQRARSVSTMQPFGGRDAVEEGQRRPGLAVAERPSAALESGHRQLARLEGEDRLKGALQDERSPDARRGAVILADDMGNPMLRRHATLHSGPALSPGRTNGRARFYRSLTHGNAAPAGCRPSSAKPLRFRA